MPRRKVRLSPVKCVSRSKARCRAVLVPAHVVCRVENATHLQGCTWAGHPAAIYTACEPLPTGVAIEEALRVACTAYFDADRATEIHNNRVALFAPVVVLCGCALLAAVYMAVQRGGRGRAPGL